MADTEKPARDEEFYYLLTEGSELLQAGKVDDARRQFERALEMNPSHEQALNLLGLALFRLNHLDRARQIFADLVHNSPIEPSLRLNLAMVHLKTGKLDDAAAELEHVLELNPDHPRATSYMGLVLERKGDLDRAAAFYERAGNKKRADEIRAYRPTATGTFPLPNLAALVASASKDEAPAPSPPSTPPQAASTPPQPASTPPQAASTPPQPASTPPPPPPTQPATTPPQPAPPQATPSAPPTAPKPITGVVSIAAIQTADVRAVLGGGARASQPIEAAALTAAAASTLKKAAEPPPAAAAQGARDSSLGYTFEVEERATATTAAPSPAVEAPPAADEQKRPAVDEGRPERPAPAAASRLREERLSTLAAAAIVADEPSLRDDGILTFPIPDVGYVRTDLLAALSGQFEIEPVNRRYRGKRTDSLFGGVDGAIAALLGRGLALLHPDKLHPRLLALKNEELYLVESALLAFTQGLVWENGRLPSEADRDLDIVHLRGTGKLVLGSKDPVVTLAVRPDAPVVVHAARLVGWSGQLVPYRAPLPGLPDAAKRVPVVRFEGTGTVLAV
ncbi:MAG: tetratricopeptide repeat protein [Deltaproteobacteria bacterium]|nr:tetratricopeptide repeat protein [Deltaproteobacteria bacterium]